MRSVSIKGSSYARFRRSLEVGTPLAIRAAAAELHRIELGDALRITLVLRVREPASYPRAAARWLARFALEVPGVQLADVQLAAAGLAAIAADRVPAGAEALAAVAQAHHLREVEQAVDEMLAKLNPS